MTEYRRIAKNPGTYEAVAKLKEQLAAEEAEHERLQHSSDQARRVVDRWSTTFNHRTAELNACERRIAEITTALNVLAPEVDEYGIPRHRVTA
jgi:chromosome segregation ATPase